MTLAEEQSARLKRNYPGTDLHPLPDGSTLIVIPNFSVPGWNQPNTTVYFIAPVGYPMAKPDCFWTDEALRLQDGELPKNAAMQSPPFGSGVKLWFSWHVEPWNPGSDDLLTFAQAVSERLKRLE